MNLVQERIGDANTSLGFLIIIAAGCLLLFLIYLKGRK